MECPQCHRTVEDDATTCTNCGADLRPSPAAGEAAGSASTGERASPQQPFDYYLHVLRNYVQFSGRARRAEYWYFVLFNVLIMLGLSIVDGVLGTVSVESGTGLLSGLYSLAVVIPGIAVAARRLHDTDRSGWWLLLIFIPVIGFLVLLFFMVLDSTPGPNRYGDNPKGVTA